MGNGDSPDDGDSGQDEEADEATSGGGCLSMRRRFLFAGVSSGSTDSSSLDWGVPAAAECEGHGAGVADVAGLSEVTTDNPIGSAAKAFAYGSHSSSTTSACARADSHHESSMMLADTRGALGK